MQSDNLRPLSAVSIALLEGLGLKVEKIAIDLDAAPRASAEILHFSLHDRMEEARRLLRVEGADVSAVACIANLTVPQVRSIRQHMRDGA